MPLSEIVNLTLCKPVNIFSTRTKQNALKEMNGEQRLHKSGHTFTADM